MVCALGNYNTNLLPLTNLQVLLFNPFPPKSVMISKRNTNLDFTGTVYFGYYNTCIRPFAKVTHPLYFSVHTSYNFKTYCKAYSMKELFSHGHCRPPGKVVKHLLQNCCSYDVKYLDGDGKCPQGTYTDHKGYFRKYSGLWKYLLALIFEFFMYHLRLIGVTTSMRSLTPKKIQWILKYEFISTDFNIPFLPTHFNIKNQNSKLKLGKIIEVDYICCLTKSYLSYLDLFSPRVCRQQSNTHFLKKV